MMRRVETGESHVGEVPLSLFQGKIFKEKGYLDKAEEIVLQGIEALNIPKDEPIHVCSGYILSKARDELRERGYNIVQRKITGATQELAEAEFIRSLARMGVGAVWEVSQMRSFPSFLEWVHEDLEHRERFVKTGWSAWPRHRREGGPK